jgi:hypothetical protein
MKGEIVVVKDRWLRPFLRRIWQSTDDTVFITSKWGFRRLERGEETPWPIGVPEIGMFSNTLEESYRLT